MLTHEQYHLAILKEAVTRTRGGEETLGWETHRGTLNTLLSTAGLDSTGRAPDDALLLLRNQKKIALQKIVFGPPHRTYRIADFSEYPNARQFFSGPFNVRVLPEGIAYLSELEGKKAAGLESAEMAKRMQPKKRFAVGTDVLVGMGARPGQVTFLDDRPSTLGEYVHKVKTESGEETVLGCELDLVPEPVTNSHRRPVAGFGNVHFYGDNSRVNVNSNDNSTNTVSHRNESLFMEMRQTAQKIGDENTRNEVISSIEELERTQGQSGWTHAYERFVGLVADHITIFAPFLPKLMHIATGLL
jgi:hypothetical protein